MPRRLLLVRHGESTWNVDGRWQGWADAPLSPLGEAQAKEAAGRLATMGLTGVGASDLIRARRTAEIVADALGLGEVVVEPGLRERNVGDWAGLTRPEIRARWPEELAAWDAGVAEAAPHGETREEFLDRIFAGLRRLAGIDALGDQPFVVSHGGVVRALERQLGIEPDRPPNLAGRWLEVGPDGEVTAGDAVVLLDEAHRTKPESE